MEIANDSPNLLLLNVGYSDLDANWNWENVYSPFARLYYVTKGCARTKVNGKVYELKPNYLYLIPPFTQHDNFCDSLFSLYYIHFYEKTANKFSVFDIYDFPIEIEVSLLDASLVERLLQINPNRELFHFDPQFYDRPPIFSRYIADNNKMPLYANVETQGILQILIARFLRYMCVKTTMIDARVEKCVEFIHHNLDKEISLSDLADRVSLSEDHFIRLFRKEMDATPISYINNNKMKQAQLFLLTTDMSVKRIALELGMDNISYFNRIFKQHVGKTPTEYRKENS